MAANDLMLVIYRTEEQNRTARRVQVTFLNTGAGEGRLATFRRSDPRQGR